MKKLLTGAFLAAFAAGGAQAADDVTLQLKWVTQAQFAGYYVAKAKGFYDEEGLNVTIKPGGPDIAPSQVIAGGGADVVIDWMPSALAAREKGLAGVLRRRAGSTMARSNIVIYHRRRQERLRVRPIAPWSANSGSRSLP